MLATFDSKKISLKNDMVNTGKIFFGRGEGEEEGSKLSIEILRLALLITLLKNFYVIFQSWLSE